MSDSDPATAPAPAKRCESCGTAIDSGRVAALCPVCLLSLATGGGWEAGEPGADPMPELLDPLQVRWFGDYELLEEISRGGMGVVYRARHARLNREVAVKMILAGELAGREAVQMFRTEARAAAGLHHPHIIPVYEIGEHETQNYFTMRYVPGGWTIADWGREHAGNWRLIATQAALVARAVGHAHARGVLHRDLKPSNILWDPDDGPQVTDFGLAKLLDARDAAVTLSAAMLGSPSYMAPEQCDRTLAEVTTASDVYGIGAVLYELLAARPPFVGRSVLDTARMVVEHEAPPPVGAPRELATICLKCLAKRPADRYRSAIALAEDLERYSRGEPVVAVPLAPWVRLWRWAGRHPVPAALGALCLLLAAAGASGVVGQWLRAERANDELLANVSRLEWRRIVNLLEDGEDHRGLVELARLLRADPHHPQAASMALSALDLRGPALPVAPPLRHSSGEPITRAWFVDQGTRVLTTDADGRIMAWDAADGRALGPESSNGTPPDFLPRRLVTDRALSPDGRREARWRDGSLRVFEAPDGADTGLDFEGASAIFDAAWAPDGGRLAAASSNGWVRVWDAHGTPLSPLLWHRYFATGTRFAPDGATLFSSGSDGLIFRTDPLTGRRTGAPLMHPKAVMSFDISPDGSRLVAVSRPWNDRAETRYGIAMLWDVRRHAPEPQRFDHGGFGAAVAWSPDGRSFALSTTSGLLALFSAGDGELLWEARTRSYARGMTFLPGGLLGIATMGGEITIFSAADGSMVLGPIMTDELEAAWFAPCGRLLATGALNGEVLVWDLADGKVVTRPPAHTAPLNGLGWSPDGRLVASAAEDGLCIVSDAATGRPLFEPLRSENEFVSVRFSADGRSIVTASHDGTAGVWNALTGEPLTPPLRHQSEVAHASFDSSGERIVTLGRDGVARVWDARDGTPLGEAMRHPRALRSASFCPDGRRIVTEDHEGLRLWDAATGEPLTLTLPRPTLIGIGYDGQGLRATFCPEGRRVLHGTATSDTVIWDFPDPPAPAPAWLPDLLEAAATLALDERGVAAPLPAERWLSLRTTLRDLEGEGFYETWARRFAAATD